MEVDNDYGPVLLAKRVVNRLGRPFGINPFPRAFPNTTTASIDDRVEVFDSVSRSNFWGSVESRSGIGSERNFSLAYLAPLRSLIHACRLHRIFDAPCGDLNWIADLARDPAIDYLGGDISTRLVADLHRRFSEIEVRVFDICFDVFPEADVWHCRDCLFHLSTYIRRAFENFALSSIPFALLTTHGARWLHQNLDVSLGGFRHLDLERAPIGFRTPKRTLSDYRTGRDFARYVGLWCREDVLKAIGVDT